MKSDLLSGQLDIRNHFGQWKICNWASVNFVHYKESAVEAGNITEYWIWGGTEKHGFRVAGLGMCVTCKSSKVSWVAQNDEG